MKIEGCRVVSVEIGIFRSLPQFANYVVAEKSGIVQLKISTTGKG